MPCCSYDGRHDTKIDASSLQPRPNRKEDISIREQTVLYSTFFYCDKIHCPVLKGNLEGDLLEKNVFPEGHI